MMKIDTKEVGGQRCDDALVSSISLLRTLGRDDEVVHVAIAELEFVRSFLSTITPAALELAAVKAELTEARSGNRYAQLERLAIKRAERAEAGERAAHDAANTAIRQRDEARAALAETKKALEQAEQQLDYGQVDAAHRIIIRALTGGQEDE